MNETEGGQGLIAIACGGNAIEGLEKPNQHAWQIRKETQKGYGDQPVSGWISPEDLKDNYPTIKRSEGSGQCDECQQAFDVELKKEIKRTEKKENY